MSRYIDRTGNIYGCLEVLSYNSTNKFRQAMWNCYCSKCNSISVISGQDLQKSKHKYNECRYCSDLQEINKRYGKLLVLKRGENTDTQEKRLICQCDCGKEVLVRQHDLRNNHTTSCGCETTGFKDETGNIYGYLKVLSYYGNGKWRCECLKCGSTTITQGSDLRKKGHIISCGCINSKGEFYISKLLIENNYIFQKQYSFEDLKDIYKLRFDFAIFNSDNTLKCLIEYQGIQHFDSNNKYYNEDMARHDQMKVEYCKNNNIPLIFFSYKDKELTSEILNERINNDGNYKT